MMIYIKSINIVVWKAVKEGYIGPKKLKGITVTHKPKNEWDENDYNKKRNHAKVMNAIMYVATLVNS